MGRHRAELEFDADSDGQAIHIGHQIERAAIDEGVPAQLGDIDKLKQKWEYADNVFREGQPTKQRENSGTEPLGMIR